MVRSLIFAVLLAPCLANAQSFELQPAYLLQLPASIGNVFIAETDSSTLYRFVPDANTPNSHDERYMSVGQNGVGKRRAGDRRTPLGIYFVNEELDTSGLHEKYGPLAFPLDYPNVFDRLSGRSGDGIWIHGVDPRSGRRPPRDTDGCIALPNDELLKLESDVVPLVTPVIIAREIRWARRSEITALRDELWEALQEWAESYRSGNLHRHLAMYANDFTYRGLSRDEWSAFRLQTIGSRPVQDVILDEALLLADPEERDLFLSRFRQTIVDNDREIVTIKRLYWRRSQSGDFRIVAEDNG